jgi:hypothetical protein
MKTTIALTILLAGTVGSLAQEQLSREESLKYAFVASANLKEMLKTPIPTDPDVKRPVAARDGEYGAMVLPESKLTADVMAKAGKEAVPVGQLWLVKLAPLSDGRAVPASKLRVVHLNYRDKEADAPCCALGVRKTDSGGLELLVYGKESEPVLRVPLKRISSAQDNPIEMSAERKDDGGLITLNFLGRYSASFMVTDPDQN